MTRIFLVSIFNNKPRHIPLNYKCPIKKSDPVRFAYLTMFGVGGRRSFRYNDITTAIETVLVFPYVCG